jgi:Protein of unknown function (DUF3826)
MKPNSTIVSSILKQIPSCPSRVVLLAVVIAATFPVSVTAAEMPAAVVAEDSANNAVAEKRSSGIMETLKLADKDQAARVKRHIVNFILTLKNIHEGKNAPQGDAKKEALVKARGELYAGLEAEKLTTEQQEVVKNGLSANHFKINYDAFLGLIPKLTDEEKKYIHDQLATGFDEAVLLNEGTAKGDVFHKLRGRINNYLAKRGYDLKQLSIERNARTKSGKDGQ